MADKTYIEICKNSKSTIQLNISNRSTGSPYNGISGAYYEIKGAAKDNTLISRTPVTGHSGNQVWITVTQTITASAASYDLYWELRRDDGDVTPHCTKVLVSDAC